MDHNEHKAIQQYMVEFVIPTPTPDYLYELVPEQQEAVHKLFGAGRLLTYTLSINRGKLWAVFLAGSESELLSYIDKMPITQYVEYQYSELMFHQSLKLLPSMSLN